MASKHTYEIDLNLEQSAQSKQAIQHLRDAFADSGQSLNDLNKAFVHLSDQMEDNAALEREYDAIIKRELRDRDNQITQLLREQSAIERNAELSEDQREQELKRVKLKIRQLSTARAEIKASQTEAKLQTKIGRQRQADAAAAEKQRQAEEKQNKALEKRLALYGKIKKAAGAAAKVASGVGKVAAVGGGVAAAAGGMIFGAVAGSAEAQAEKEKALKSLKAGVDPSLADKVFVKTGADYSTIIAAINNVSSLSRNPSDIVAAASLEIQNPGAGALLLSRTQGGTSDIQRLSGAIEQIRKQTGVADITSAINASMKSRLVTRGDISQREYLLAYSKLQALGLSEEETERALRAVVKKGGDFVEAFNATDFTRFTRDLQLRQRIANQGTMIAAITEGGVIGESSAQSIAEKLRELQLKKDEMLVKFLPIVNNVLDKITSAVDMSMVDKIVDGLLSLFETVIPLLDPLLKLLDPVLTVLKKVLDVLSPVIKFLVDGLLDLVNFFTGDDDKPAIAVASVAPQPNVNNPITNSSSTVYNTTQNYNIAGPATTTSLERATASNSYVRKTATVGG
jgi:hypothetical protein